MDLWSKGLGKRVLSMNLQEYEESVKGDDGVIVKGVLGPPVFWEYKLTLKEDDFVYFYKLITTGTGAVDFVIHSKKQWIIYYKVVKNIIKFLWMATGRLLKGFFFPKKKPA